jgi:prophage DNA circulation protein
MTWADKLNPASFRGVKFGIITAPVDGGRRGDTHEYPYRDDTYTQDMGAKALGVKITGFLVGPDYLQQQQQLLKALNQPGPGTLVHPELGELTVKVDTWSTSFSRDELGYCQFDITFVQHGALPLPSARVDTQAQSAARAEAAQQAVASQFENQYMLARQPNYLGEDATAKFTEFGQLASGVAPTDGITPVLNFLTRLPLFVAKATQLASEVRTVVQALSGTNRSNQRLAVLTRFGDTWPMVPNNTPARSQQNANAWAIRDLVRQTALLQQLANTATQTWDTYDAATTDRDTLASQLDDALLTASDSLYLPLKAARAAMVADISQRAVTLQRLRQVTLKQPQPALLLSYQLYGDIGAEDDIVARNRVRHPGFVPPGRPLDVLTA